MNFEANLKKKLKFAKKNWRVTFFRKISELERNERSVKLFVYRTSLEKIP